MKSHIGRTARLFPCLVVAALYVASVPAAEPTSGKIAYVAGATVYLDLGRDRGLEPGAVLPVSRGGHVIGQLEILHVSDHRAAARVKTAERPLRLEDEVAFSSTPAVPPVSPSAVTPVPPSAVTPVPSTSTPRPPSAVSPVPPSAVTPVPPSTPRPPTYLVIPEAQLARDWTLALAQAPLPQVKYTSTAARGGHRTRAAAETALVGATDVPALSRTRLEQNIALWARGVDVGARGLDVRIRADFDLRYDAVTDRYLPGQRAYPLVREVAVRYLSARGGWATTAGRFRPGVRQSDLVDGAQLAWNGKQLGLVAFGGLKPSMLELAPQPDRQAYGVALNLHPTLSPLKWAGQLSYGGDLAGGTLARQTLAMDNHLSWSRLTAHQSVTLDSLAAGGALDGRTGIGLAEVFGGVRYRLLERLELSLSGRRLSRALLTADAAELPETWAEQLSSRRIVRSDGGARLELSGRQSVQPYLFWHEEAYPDQETTVVRGGGASWHLSGFLGGPLGLDVAGDYGDGTRQQGTLQVSVQGPIAADRLQLAGGLMNFWTFGHESGMHTLQHLLHARLDGQVLERVHVWATMMGGVDWNIAHGPAIPGGVLMGELGGTWVW